MPRKTKREKELDVIHAELDKERMSLMRKTAAETALLLTNPDGFLRLMAISDEEWAAAEARGSDDAA